MPHLWYYLIHAVKIKCSVRDWPGIELSESFKIKNLFLNMKDSQNDFPF